MKKIRPQHILVLLALAALIVCLCFPLVTITYADSTYVTLTNFQVNANGDHSSASPWALGALLIAAAAGQFFVLLIAAFQNYTLQKRTLVFSMLLLAGYYVVYLIFLLVLKEGSTTIIPSWTTILPLIAIILDFMSFRSILHTEAKIIASGNSFRLRD